MKRRRPTGRSREARRASTGGQPPHDGPTAALPLRPRLGAALRRLSQNPRISFAASFAAIAGVLLCAYHHQYEPAGYADRLFQGYLAAYARGAAVMVRLFDGSAEVHGNVIAGLFSVEVVRTCDAADSKVLVAAAILSFPAPWRWRLGGVVICATLLAVLNLVRISSLYVIGWRFPGSFGRFHSEIWPFVMLIGAAGLFLAWAYRASGRKTATPHAV